MTSTGAQRADVPRRLEFATRRAGARLRTELRALDREVLLGAAVVFATFLVLEPLLHAAWDPPRDVYREPVIAWAALLRSPAVAAGWLLSLVAFARAPRWGLWWRLPTTDRRLWIPTAAILATLAWHLVTLDENWYLGRAFGVDRAIVALVGVAAAVHPAFLAAFVVVAHTFTGQLNVPGMYFSWTDTMVLYLTLVALFAWALLRDLPLPTRIGPGRSGRPRLRLPAASAFAVAFGLLAAWYVKPAVGKIRLRWLWETNLSYIFRGTFEQHGWLGFLGPERHEQLARAIESAAPLMQAVALFSEVVVLLFFVSRRATFGILALCLGLHVMVFATTGIMFWKWAVLLLSYAALFATIAPSTWRRDFPRWTMVAATATVALVYVAFGPRVKYLAWYDSPFVYRFDMEVTGESGTRYEVIPATLTPFDSRFAQSRFYFLTEIRRVSDCFGSVNHHTAYRALCDARTADDVRRAIATWGVPKTSAEERAKLEALLRRFLVWTHEVDDRRASGERGFDAGPAKAPLHIWTRQRHDATLPLYAFQEPLVRLDMTLVERHRFMHAPDDGYVEILREPVLSLAVDPAPADASPVDASVERR